MSKATAIPQDPRAHGHQPMTPLQVLRAHCLDCSGHDPGEVAKCPVTRCPSWPFRFGRNPWRVVSEAQRAASRANARHLRSGARENHWDSAPTTGGGRRTVVRSGTASESPETDGGADGAA